MSETVSWQFVGRRLDSIQEDVADVRRSMTGLSNRFAGIEARLAGIEGRFTGIEDRIGGMERRQVMPETRLDALMDRISRQEEVAHRSLLLIERIAAKVKIDEGSN